MTHISAYIMGGLGNQLFQIFTAISISIEQNIQFIFPYYELSPGMTKRPTYWNNLLSNLLQFTTKKSKLSIQDINNFFVLREKHHCFVSVPKILHNTLLFGYFQSYKYFHHNLSQILDLIKYNSIRDNIYSQHSQYFTNQNSTSIISIHFRFGDYLTLDNVFEILDSKYYIQSIKNIIYKDLSRNVRFLYFFESSDSNHVSPIIDKIRDFTNSHSDFSFQHVNVSHNIDDWEQMVLMSCCNHNIIANSSFSWWGAYLNSNPYKHICYPNKWFGIKEQQKQNELFDMFPDNWTKI